MLPNEISRCIKAQSAAVYSHAAQRCNALVAQAKTVIEDYSQREGLDLNPLCIVVVGSVGRSEALGASDFDITPIARDESTLDAFLPHDQPIRQALRDALNVKVSKGEDLTKSISICSIV